MSRNNNDDVEATKFRNQVRPKHGEWNFAGVYERPQEVARSQAAINADNLRMILEGTHRELRASRVRDLIGDYLRDHESTLCAYADELTRRRGSDKSYQDSLIVGREKFKLFMDSFIDVLRDSLIDFRKMTDTAHPNAGAEALKIWLETPRKLGRLDDTLKMANIETSKNDLRVTDTEFAAKIRAASEALATIKSTFKDLAEQQAKAYLL